MSSWSSVVTMFSQTNYKTRSLSFIHKAESNFRRQGSWRVSPTIFIQFQESRHFDKVLCSLFLSLVNLAVMFMLDWKPPWLRPIFYELFEFRSVWLLCDVDTIQYREWLQSSTSECKVQCICKLYRLRYVNHSPQPHVSFSFKKAALSEDWSSVCIF